jgi:hypothetical protein
VERSGGGDATGGGRGGGLRAAGRGPGGAAAGPLRAAGSGAAHHGDGRGRAGVRAGAGGGAAAGGGRGEGPRERGAAGAGGAARHRAAGDQRQAPRRARGQCGCRRSGGACCSFWIWVRLASRFDCGDWVFALWVQIKLSKERDSLAQTSKKLARDLQKVPSFDPSSAPSTCLFVGVVLCS